MRAAALGGFDGAQIFWLDNLIFGANTNRVSPPTLTLSRVIEPAGLAVVASGPGDYPREMIATVDPENPDWEYPGEPRYSWVGYGDTPITYSFTIAAYPDAAHSAFQTHLFLIPRGGYNDPSIDWNSANAVFVQVLNRTNGTAAARFMYKTNQPAGNSMYFNTGATAGVGVGTLASLESPSPLGTWSVTFRNDTNVTLTAPDGVSTNFFFPDAATVQELFGNPLTAYVGCQKQGANNDGQLCVLSRVQIGGITASPAIDERFSGPALNSDPDHPKWRVVAAVPEDVFRSCRSTGSGCNGRFRTRDSRSNPARTSPPVPGPTRGLRIRCAWARFGERSSPRRRSPPPRPASGGWRNQASEVEWRAYRSAAPIAGRSWGFVLACGWRHWAARRSPRPRPPAMPWTADGSRIG